MSLPAVIDIDAILVPIPGDRPGGIDPRENASGTAPYYRVKDARNAARAEERAAVEADAPIPEAWGLVIDGGVGLLSEQAKDLEVAAWLTEALVRVEGFAGLRDGLTVIARLVEDHWETLFPEPDEEGIETKVSPVAGLNGSGATGTLDRPIRNAKLTSGGNGAYSFWDYEQAVELEKIADDNRRDARIKGGAITLEMFRNSIADTPLQSLRDTLSAIGECEAALTRMGTAFDLVAGADAPSISALQELLAAVGGCLRFVAGDRIAIVDGALDAVADFISEAAVSADPAGVAEGAALRRPGEFFNREEALTQLTHIAAYFRRTEPQALLSYTIDDAVRRARMPLPDLLKELAQDPGHMQYILLKAGVQYDQE